MSKPHDSKRYPLMVWAVYLVEMAFAAALVITGVIMPNLIQTYQMTYGQAGVLTAVQCFTSLPLVFIAGFLSQRWNSARALQLGLVLLVISPVFMAVAPSRMILFVAAGILGMGLGLTDPMTNAVLVEQDIPNKGRVLGLLHAFFGIGAALFPLVVAYLMKWGSSWRLTLGLLSVILVIALIWFKRCHGREGNKRAESVSLEEKETGEHQETRKIFVLGIFCAGMFLYGGAYRNIMTWVVVFFQDTLGASQTVGSVAMFLLFGLLVIGRLITAVISDKVSNLLLLTGFMNGAALAMVPLSWVRSPMAGLFIMGAIGLASAGIYPVITAYTTARYPSSQGRVISLLYGSSAAGSIVLPWIVGSWMDRVGIRGGLTVNTAFMAAAGLLFIILMVREKLAREKR